MAGLPFATSAITLWPLRERAFEFSEGIHPGLLLCQLPTLEGRSQNQRLDCNQHLGEVRLL